MRIKLAPSIMCADYANLEATVRELEEAGADILHVDIMDGRYVPNLVIGPDYVRTLRRITKLPLDLHFMCLEPERFIPMFEPAEGEMIGFHPDTTLHAHKLVMDVKRRGCRAGLLLGPHLGPDAIAELAPDLDYFTVMTIDTGFPGGGFYPRNLDKIGKVKAIAKAHGGEITALVDGGVSFDNATDAVAKGADILCLGYAGCFNRELGVRATMERIISLVKDL